MDRKRKIDDGGNVIWINGGAGTGKTVLLSNLFYELLMGIEVEDVDEDSKKKSKKKLNKLKCALVVNHDEQFKAYEDVFRKLKVKKKNDWYTNRQNL